MSTEFLRYYYEHIEGRREDVEPEYTCRECGGEIDEDTAVASELCADCCAIEAGKRLDREDAIKAHLRAQLLRLPGRRA